MPYPGIAAADFWAAKYSFWVSVPSDLTNVVWALQADDTSGLWLVSHRQLPHT